VCAACGGDIVEAAMRGAVIVMVIGALFWALCIHKLNGHACWAADDFLGTNPYPMTYWCSRPVALFFLAGSVVSVLATITAALYLLYRLVRLGLSRL
jgi:hypothetical protein